LKKFFRNLLMKGPLTSLILSLAMILNAQNETELPVLVLLSSHGGDFLTEGCQTPADTLIINTPDIDSSLTLAVSVTGTGERDVDYFIDIPEEITLQIDSVLKFGFGVIEDTLVEDVETIIVQLTDPVTDSVIYSKTVLIFDQLDVNILDSVFTVSVTEENQRVFLEAIVGSCTLRDEIDVTISTGIQFTAGDTTYVCFPDSTNLDVRIIGDPDGQIQWNPLDTSLWLLSSTSAIVHTDRTKTYTIRFQNDECLVSDTIVVRIDSLPPELPIDIVPEKEEYCPGEKVALFSPYLGPAGYPDVTFQWNFESGSPLNDLDDQNLFFTTVETSTFTRITTNNACQIQDSVEINVVDPPVELTLNDTTVCPNQPVKVELINGDTLDKIEWMPEQGISCTDCKDPTIRTPQSATYTATGELKGCPASASVTVNIFPPERLTVVPDTMVCPGEPVQINILEASEYEDFDWTGSGLSCSQCDDPTATVSRPTFFLVSAVKDDGCMGQGGLALNTFTLPSVIIQANPPGPVEQGTAIMLMVQTSPDVSGTGQFNWTRNGDLISPTGPVIETEVLSESNTFEVTITTPQGCEVRSQIEIEGLPPRYEIPNAFTPNGDEVNDRFRVVIFGNITLQNLQVFNRWGQKVYDSSDSEGWDGLYNGEDAPSDVYAFIASMELPDGRIEKVRGDVTLIR
jgi:gliding motility-associated-like protein